MSRKLAILSIGIVLSSIFVSDIARAADNQPKIDVSTTTEAPLQRSYIWLQVLETGRTYRYFESTAIPTVDSFGLMISAAISGSWEGLGRNPDRAVEIDVNSRLFEKYISPLIRRGSVEVKGHDLYNLKQDLHYLGIFVRETPLTIENAGGALLHAISQDEFESITTPSGVILKSVAEGVFDIETGLIWHFPELNNEERPLELNFMQAYFHCNKKRSARLATRAEVQQFLGYLKNGNGNLESVDSWFPNFDDRWFWTDSIDTNYGMAFSTSSTAENPFRQTRYVEPTGVLCVYDTMHRDSSLTDGSE